MQDTKNNQKEKASSILLVEDDAATARLIAHLLGREGYVTTSAKDGAEAAALLGGAAPDVILLDIMLPDVNGLDFLKRLKADPALSHIPVLILSGVEETGSKVEGLDAGAEDYIVKPINKREMYARVRVAMRKAQSENRLRADLNTAYRQSITDKLTGLYNRHHLSDFIEKEISGARRYGGMFSLLIADVDHFKSVNDTFGHLAGDSVLRELAELLKEHTRDSDVVARYGGEEFVVVLPHIGVDSAVSTAEKLRRSAEAFRFRMVEGRDITVSIGVTGFDPEKDTEMADIVKRADDALYKAKQSGRNRVVAG